MAFNDQVAAPALACSSKLDENCSRKAKDLDEGLMQRQWDNNSAFAEPFEEATEDDDDDSLQELKNIEDCSGNQKTLKHPLLPTRNRPEHDDHHRVAGFYTRLQEKRAVLDNSHFQLDEDMIVSPISSCRNNRDSSMLIDDEND